MKEIKTITRKWGNSVGVLLGKEFKPDTRVRILVSEEKKATTAGDIFGILTWKKSAEELEKKIDRDLGL